jgi:thiaminase/transcriptional activator TenA
MDPIRTSGLYRERSAALWEAILAHPFVRGIGVGDLSRERFVHYLEQDYAYLVELGRVLAVASAKSETLSDMAYFAKLLYATLEFEMALHKRTCADFGIREEDLDKVEPSLVTTAYSSFLVRTCYEGSAADILAALLPCEMGYLEIADALRAGGLPADRHCRDWIETYSSDEFRGFARWVAGRLDALSLGAPSAVTERRYRLYQTSARFELLFFEMGWTRSTWPAISQA